MSDDRIERLVTQQRFESFEELVSILADMVEVARLFGPVAPISLSGRHLIENGPNEVRLVEIIEGGSISFQVHLGAD